MCRNNIIDYFYYIAHCRFFLRVEEDFMALPRIEGIGDIVVAVLFKQLYRVHEIALGPHTGIIFT